MAPIIVLPAENKMSSISDLAQPRGAPADDAQFSRCTLDLCFNLARCPLTRPFSVFVYNDANPHLFPVSSRHGNVVTDFVTDLKRTGSFTSDPTAACVFVAILENRASSGEDMPRDLQTKILSLAHWGGEGANHVLIELSTSRDTASSLDAAIDGVRSISRQSSLPVKPCRSDSQVLLIPLADFGSRRGETCPSPHRCRERT
ncbi:Exostosin-like 3 [Geodia barretti]|uniref:Exostosin-like 3 n=1 Tax=Geodia barretti TaxID=519541 RepID=A0AA35SM68_GEOBA|nr:Exostosin-like 3 [Geodia barretti]